MPPRPAERGVRRHPTLVQNVETLANIALIAAARRPDWFRRTGRPGDGARPGTALITVTGTVARPGVYEVDLGMPRSASCWTGPAGTPSRRRPCLAGGYFGGWLPLPAGAGVRLTDQALRAAGAALGPGVLVAAPRVGLPPGRDRPGHQLPGQPERGPVRPVR